MNDETEMMTCDFCGKIFPADARACVESGWDAVHDDEGEEWKGECDQPALTPETISAEQREQMKAAMELDDAQLDELLRTGKVEGLGAIVCLECQDAGLEAAEAEQ